MGTATPGLPIDLALRIDLLLLFYTHLTYLLSCCWNWSLSTATMLAFARLPFSLLVSSVILASTALPVESSETELLVLTPDNFESTIAEGVW